MNCSASRERAEALKLAADIARRIGMVRSWPNLQTIRLAIESEADYSHLTIVEAAKVISTAALEFTIIEPERYSFQAAHLLRKSNVVNRFWFEDALWRYKPTYERLIAALRESA